MKRFFALTGVFVLLVSACSPKPDAASPKDGAPKAVVFPDSIPAYVKHYPKEERYILPGIGITSKMIKKMTGGSATSFATVDNPEQVIAFYDTTLVQAGFSKMDVEKQFNVTTASFLRDAAPAEVISLTITKGPANKSIVQLMHMPIPETKEN